MLFSRLTALSLCALSLASATAAPVTTLYDGGGLPTAQGWTRSGTGSTQTVGSGTTEFATANDANGITSQFDLYRYASGATDYIASIRLQVISSSYNSYDGAIVFSAFGGQSDLAVDRYNTIMIGQGVVLWGDELGGSVTVDTSVFHDYELRYKDGKLDLFIDASFADIASGAATAALSRTTGPSSGKQVGTLVWGDATNDGNYNSDYIVDNVRFDDLNATATVPEPASFAMVALGLAGLAVRRRKQR